MLFSIIFAVVAALLVIIAEAMFNNSDLDISDYGFVNFVRGSVEARDWEKAIVIGLIVGAIRYFAPMASWTGIVCFVATIGLLGYLCWYWQAEGSEIRELVCFVLLAILVFFAGGKATSVVAGLVKGGFFKFVLGRLPLATLVGSIGYMLCNFLHYRAEEYAEDDEEEALYNRWTKIVAVLTAIAVILVFVIGANWSAVNFGKNKAKDPVATEEPVVTEEPEEEDWFGFYNLNLLLDDDSENDFNFGWNPYDENTVGKSYDEDLRSRMKIDPALGAAVLAWFDANVGTRFMGVFYDEVDSKWDAAINLAKERFMADQEEYNATLDAFFKYLDASVKEVKVEEKKNIADQMYMNPYTTDGTPDVIVVETPDHEGHFLIYVLKIKGTGIFEVAFRIDCGYQPCNVEKVMQITPQSVETIKKAKTTQNTGTTIKTGTSKSSSGGSSSVGRSSGGSSSAGVGRSSNGISSGGIPSGGRPYGGSSGGSGGRSGGGGSSSRSPKDPTKGTDVGKNDTTGPGTSTNNGVGAKESTADQPTNSSHKSSLSSGSNSYDAAIEQNKEANRTTRTSPSNGSSGSKGSSSSGAGTSNTPSSSRSGTDNVDSNAEKGTGNGGIDTPTTKAETHVQTSDGATHSVSNDSPGTSWSGPVD